MRFSEQQEQWAAVASGINITFMPQILDRPAFIIYNVPMCGEAIFSSFCSRFRSVLGSPPLPTTDTRQLLWPVICTHSHVWGAQLRPNPFYCNEEISTPSKQLSVFDLNPAPPELLPRVGFRWTAEGVHLSSKENCVLAHCEWVKSVQTISKILGSVTRGARVNTQERFGAFGLKNCPQYFMAIKPHVYHHKN